MRYRITILPVVVKALKKIPESDRKRIGAKINDLADNPRPAGVKKLAGENSLYRVRVGDYRIVYMIEDEVVQVLVIRVGDRKDVYRFLKL
jgi:mRNA interferase RelE/StbE